VSGRLLPVDPQPVVFRPRRIRWVAGFAAAAVVTLFTALSFGLHGTAGFENSGHFERGDQTAMIGLGVLIGLGFLAFTRPRVRADGRGITIRNVVGGYQLPWSVVRAVRFDRSSAWATLELYDDETVSIHALQAADKQYAVEGVRALRALHQAATDVAR
jgi:Bacterial PH domain